MRRRLRSISDQTLGIFLLAAAIGTLGGLLGAGFQHGVRWLQSVLIGPSVWENGALADAVLTSCRGRWIAFCALLIEKKNLSATLAVEFHMAEFTKTDLIRATINSC